ncbi:copper resistance CopC family protein [Streptomyces sp. NPDC048659]|uniref:copper resistance CopC family protein n=1 Tax=Streptomyces sp. NPDC048659 TaxID=3155489 RepID=UPI003439636F
MRIGHARPARTAARSLLLPPAVAALLAVSAPQAAAHTDLTGADPANGAVLTAVPGAVTLTFSDPMTQKYAQLAVTGPDGAALGAGAPKVTGREVRLTLRAADAGARGGDYTVGYRVVSADGHPVTGKSTFTVRPPKPTAPTTPTPRTPSPTTATATTSPSSPAPSPSPTLSRTAKASGERAVTSLKAVGIGFGIGLVGLAVAMTRTVRRRRRAGDDAGR